MIDRLRVCEQEHQSSEGFRLLWFHSTRKAQRDARSRARVLDRASKQLAELQSRLQSSRTRFRQRDKVESAVKQILDENDLSRWLSVQILELEEEAFKQATRGRPGKNTRYVRETTLRYKLSWAVSTTQIEHDQATDGVFPLITNQQEMDAGEVLRAYRRQPFIEKRFSQFKSDYEVAPLYLKEVTRIQAMLAMYFFALMLQTLLERELRHALSDSEYDSLPLYPEYRTCRAPTTRRILDIFEPIQRHELSGADASEIFVTQLRPLQAQIAKWFGFARSDYGR